MYVKNPILQEFKYIFINEYQGKLLVREFYFTIKLVRGAKLIARTSYRMTIIGMQELKLQL